MDFAGIDPTRVKMEVMTVNPYAPPPRKISFGAKLASALGGFLGPVGMASSIFFPPAAAIGLFAYGAKSMGDRSMAAQQQQIAMEQAQAAARGPLQVQYFGYEAPRPGFQPVAQGIGYGPPPGMNDEVLNVMFLRDESFSAMTQQVRP